MARIANPILFSSCFGIEANELGKAGLIDPFVNVDTPLFIDPVLLEKSTHILVSEDGSRAFKDHFGNFIRLLKISRAERDAAWKGAERLLDLSEPPENGLGFGSSGRAGSSRPKTVSLAIMRTAKEIIELGSEDPEMVSLMGFFEENVGPDTISDFTTRVIIKQLAEITSKFCSDHQIALHDNPVVPQHPLPAVIGANGNQKLLVLVPQDIVRELPIANDWSEIEAAISFNFELRSQVNQMLSAVAQPTIANRKDALRKIALQSPESFAEFLDAVKEHAVTYDPNEDALAYYKMKSIFANGFGDIRAEFEYNLSKGSAEVYKIVEDTIALFKRHVEHGNLWEELWIGNKPKKKRASQLIYYAIADIFCKANNIDINPEANMGGGPIDFKFSFGYNARVLVEMKRSGGQVKHGYEKQLEFYKNASQTEYAIYVIMDYGDLGIKLNQIRKIKEARATSGSRTSDIIVIDARKKASASKRT